MLFGVAIQQRGRAPEARLGGVDLEGGVGAGSGRGRRRRRTTMTDVADPIDSVID